MRHTKKPRLGLKFGEAMWATDTILHIGGPEVVRMDEIPKKNTK